MIVIGAKRSADAGIQTCAKRLIGKKTNNEVYQSMYLLPFLRLSEARNVISVCYIDIPLRLCTSDCFAFSIVSNTN